jgi:peptidoglycan LD-endopeptidase CwlK
MSLQLFKEDVTTYQRLLASMGFYHDTIDGRWGQNTNDADLAFEAASRALRSRYGELDMRSELNIAGLHIRAQELARQFLARLADANFGLTVKILSGIRTYAAQNALFAKGRFGNPGPQVTKARGGFSNHNFGIAWDIGIFEGPDYYTGATARESAAYVRAAGFADKTVLEWGGDWTSFKDTPHYEVKTGLSISEKRARFESGTLRL